MTAVANERSYYVTRFSDEFTPCEPTLEGWAAWLAKPDADSPDGHGATDGETFAATVLLWEQDIVATRQGDGSWSFSRDPGGAPFLAVRYGEGLGWDVDNIVADRADLEAWFADNGSYCDDVEYVAVGVNEPDVRLTFHAGPPATCTVETVS